MLQRSPATALVDGDDGIGHLVMTYATNLADRAGARDAASAGSARATPTMPAPPASMPEMRGRAGMVGIYAAVSTANHMAPWGGAEALLGTNPIAIGIPAGKEAPVVLDIATSVSSFGTIRQHRGRRTSRCQEGWVVHSKTGKPITDPKKVGEGVLLPIGGYKGSGLALIIGLLAGVLNGAAFGRDVVDSPAPGTQQTNTGQFVVALDVVALHRRRRCSPPRWTAISTICARRRRCPAFDAIRLPGEDRRKRRADRSAERRRAAGDADEAARRARGESEDRAAGASALVRCRIGRHLRLRRGAGSEIHDSAAEGSVHDARSRPPQARRVTNFKAAAVDLHPGAHLRQHLRQHRLDLGARHARAGCAGGRGC